MIIIITGRPGIGKTTVFTKVVDKIRKYGFVVGGMICPEVRSDGVRTAFKIVDLMSGSQGLLAYTSVKCPENLRVGKYCVNVDDAVSIGVKAIENAVSNADLVCIDEIGPMELRVKEVRNAIIYALKNSKNILAVVHWRLNDYTIIELIKTARTYEVTLRNRDSLPDIIVNELLKSLKKGEDVPPPRN